MSFVEICNTSNFTFLTGGSHPEEYARQAFEFGMQALAISDINSVAGIARAHIELREIARKQKDEGGNKVIPRLLAAARLITDDNFTLTALPRDRYAWGQMCRMLTVAKRRAGKENCRLRFDDILEFGNGMELLLHASTEMVFPAKKQLPVLMSAPRVLAGALLMLVSALLVLVSALLVLVACLLLENTLLELAKV